MRDDRPTSKMEAVDLRMLADATADRQRITSRISRADLLGLLWQPEAEPCPVQLVVITTPPEVRERWLTWVRVRASIVLTIMLTLALVSAIHLV